MKQLFISMIVVLFCAASICPASADGSARDGEAKAKVCAGCHGMKGVSSNDLWPNLAGQKTGYLVRQITAFRDGTRQDPSMAPMVQQLSDKDIADIAVYYSGL